MLKDEILTRYYIGLFIVVFVSLFIFVGLFKALLFGLLISVVQYLFDKYVMDKLNPYIDKFIVWIKQKI